MKLKQIKLGNFDSYSFRDLEHAILLLHREIEEINKAKKTINRANKVLDPTGRHKYKRIDCENSFGIVVEEINKIIENVQSEIHDRMLTGQDDGVLEKELLT